MALHDKVQRQNHYALRFAKTLCQIRLEAVHVVAQFFFLWGFSKFFLVLFWWWVLGVLLCCSFNILLAYLRSNLIQT
jgi:hypothetical protein